MKRILWVAFLLLCGAGTNVFGQRSFGTPPLECPSKIPLKKGNFKLLSVRKGIELQVYVEVKAKHRNEANYMAVAKQLLGKYCHEKEVRIIYYATKKQWLDPNIHDIQSTPLAIFYKGDNPGEPQGLEVYILENEKVTTRFVPFTGA
jgi:hypothetical protein